MQLIERLPGGRGYGYQAIRAKFLRPLACPAGLP